MSFQRTQNFTKTVPSRLSHSGLPLPDSAGRRRNRLVSDRLKGFFHPSGSRIFNPIDKHKKKGSRTLFRIAQPERRAQKPPCGGRTFFPASLTAEAALELPLFFVLCVILLQFASVYRTASLFSDRMTQAAEELALSAYKDVYNDASGLIRASLSDAWVYKRVVSETADKDSVRRASVLGSSFLKEDDLIRLVLSYQIKPKFALIPIPRTLFVQQAVVRGWTGRLGKKGRPDGSGEDPSSVTVYVTDTGTVYHTDPSCSHLKVTVIPITRDQLASARNNNRHKYTSCPYCGRSGGDQLYVDPYGECWHTSLSCPSLKRSVNAVSLHECGDLRECADCRRKREGG